MNPLPYPRTRTADQSDSYHGVRVPDPYRWLEDNGSERAAWIAAQNAATDEYLAKLPDRGALRARFEQLLGYPRYYDLYRRGPYLLYKRNDGLQNQLVLHGQLGLMGKPEILVNPTTLAVDGTTRLTFFALSRNARYLAYGLSERGSDWQEIRIRDMHRRHNLREELRWVRDAAVAWQADGFYYTRRSAPESEGAALPGCQHDQVWYHHVGTRQAADTLIFRDADHPTWMFGVQTTQDERFVVLTIADPGGGHPGHAVLVLDRRAENQTFRRVVTGFDHQFRLVDADAGCLLFLTNRDAPNWRLALVDPAHHGKGAWRDVIPEREYPLEQVVAIGRKIFAVYRQDATHRLYMLDSGGALECEIPLPGLGLVRVFPGERNDAEALWSFATFTTPPTIYRYDIGTRVSATFLRPSLPFNADDYQTTQVFYPSRDGTKIPMFLVHRTDLVLGGQHPSLLYGYGGNGNSVGPAFDPLLLALLERGVIFAVPCLRGGGEYGETWHHSGWRDKKQTVFDDCIAAAEWLQANGYTSPDRAALIGASNGGLLVGAIMTQRPGLFAVALPAAGVMDMLRFQHFTIGHAWIAEYGTSDDPAMFPILLGYSPLHNIRRGVHYPATLVTTSEHDDCVVPAHSFKFIATLQANGSGPNPYLIRIDRRSGHGAVSLPKEIAERADLYAFLLAHFAGSTGPPLAPGAPQQPGTHRVSTARGRSSKR